MLRLRDLQDELFRVVTAGEEAIGRHDVSTLEREICGDDRLGASERLGIYARMYGLRLVDALGEDYPRVRATVGSEGFRDLALAYVAAYPSTHPSLRWYGSRFADFLAAQSRAALPPFVADLARLEWSRLMVFDAPDTDLLQVDALRRLPPEGWGDLRLRSVPALEILYVAWPVHRIWETAEGESRPLAVEYRREEVWLRVWRQGDQVYQASMDVAERTALAHVLGGDDFSTLCSGLSAVIPAEHAAATAGGLVLRWIEDGLLLGPTPRR